MEFDGDHEQMQQPEYEIIYNACTHIMQQEFIKNDKHNANMNNNK